MLQSKSRNNTAICLGVQCIRTKNLRRPTG